jgi:release factor glutamine methyltransferase
MNIQSARTIFQQSLHSTIDENELGEIFARSIDFLTGFDRLQWKLDKSIEIDESKFQYIISELQLHKPIQYILGYEWFDDIKLKVDSNVLIPRPETYELVRWIADDLKMKQNELRIIDIGTGSGCIPIWLKNKFPVHQLSAIDISKSALKIANENATNYKCQIEFLPIDILQPTSLSENKYDIIISNPPYITFPEKEVMQAQVKNFEPSIALFVTDNDALQFYKAILNFAVIHLQKKGLIYLEVNQLFAKEVKQLCEQHGYFTELRNDMYSNPRMLKATR